MQKVLKKLKHGLRYRRIEALASGSVVRIRPSGRSPLAGASGTIRDVTMGDPCGQYLVQFENGLRFRYRAGELEAVNGILPLNRVPLPHHAEEPLLLPEDRT